MRTKEQLREVLDLFAKHYLRETGREYDPVLLTTALSRIAHEKLMKVVRQRFEHLAYAEVVDMANVVAEKIMVEESLPDNVVRIGGDGAESFRAPESLNERPKRNKPTKPAK